LVKNYGVFFIPYAVLEAASTTPDRGFRIKPPIPFAAPKKNPGRPYFYAPLTGSVKKPVKPFLTPFAILLAPFASPPNTCSLLSFLMLCLSLVKD
jgi:hypothetical protein